MNQNDQHTISKNLMPTRLCDFEAVSDIRSAALKLTAECDGIEQRTESIYQFTKKLPYKYDDWDIKASETLRRGWGMCSGKANLLVAMLRTLQIPARYVITQCHAELELYEYITSQNIELKRILGEPYREVNHIFAEVFMDARWRIVDPARDQALETGMIALGIPTRMRIISQISIPMFDEWAVSRQKAVRFKSERPAILKLMNDQLEKIRSNHNKSIV